MKSIVSGLYVIVLSASVMAAAVSGADAASPTVRNWSGCHVGVNAGYGWNNGGSRYQDDPNTTADPINHVPSGALNLVYLAAPAGTGESGWLGGVGCDWQSGRFVFGFEADIDAADVKGSDTASLVAVGTQQFGLRPGGYTPMNSPGILRVGINYRLGGN